MSECQQLYLKIKYFSPTLHHGTTFLEIHWSLTVRKPVASVGLFWFLRSDLLYHSSFMWCSFMQKHFNILILHFSCTLLRVSSVWVFHIKVTKVSDWFVPPLHEELCVREISSLKWSTCLNLSFKVTCSHSHFTLWSCKSSIRNEQTRAQQNWLCLQKWDKCYYCGLLCVSDVWWEQLYCSRQGGNSSCCTMMWKTREC